MTSSECAAHLLEFILIDKYCLFKVKWSGCCNSAAQNSSFSQVFLFFGCWQSRRLMC